MIGGAERETRSKSRLVGFAPAPPAGSPDAARSREVISPISATPRPNARESQGKTRGRRPSPVRTVRRLRRIPSSPLERAAFYWNRLVVIARERSDEAIQTKLLKAFAWIGSQDEREAFVRAGSQEEGVGSASARPTTTETVECGPSFRMAERVSPLRPLSMTTAKAVAAFGGGLKGHH